MENIKSEFYFDYIDCPNCARKVEDALNKSKNIINAQVVYYSNKIIVEHTKRDIYSEVVKIVKSLEKETNVYRYENDINQNKNKRDFVKKLLFIIGIILFLCASIINVLGNKEILDKINIEPILSGYNYLIPLFILYILSYVFLAYDLIFKSIYGIFHKDFFNESLLMVIASTGAVVLSFLGDIELFEACAVVLFYKIGESLQSKATNKSRNAIKKLIELEVDSVTLESGIIEKIDKVKIGDIIRIKMGEKIPLDGILLSDSALLDMKSLTGESEPVLINVNQEILSGAMNLGEVILVQVTKGNKDSTLSKLKKIIKEAELKKSKSEKFITKFSRVYTPLILCLSLVVLIVELCLGLDYQNVLNNVFSILVISCPCSLVISIPLAYVVSLGKASSNGILVKGANYLDCLSNVEKIVFDKTGTITKGEFEVVSINPYKIDKEELMSIAASIEQYSSHPIAKCISKNYFNSLLFGNAGVKEESGLGIKLTDGKDIYLAGNDKLMKMNKINYVDCKEIGSIVYFSKNDQFLGSIVVRDQIKENAKYTINSLKVDTLMLTGDKDKYGKFVAKKVGINNVYCELLPEDKYLILNRLLEDNKGSIVYVGDGINDTPSLKRADVGISFGNVGADLAKESADIIIMNDDISKIKDVIDLSKYTKKIIIQNLVLIFSIKIIAIVISMIGLLGSYAMLLSIFADVGVCLLCILNCLKILKFKNKK